MVDDYSMVGRLMNIRPLDGLRVSERLFGLVLSG